MRVFIDTNILIDFVVNREGLSEDADKLFAIGITGDIKLMTSALSYVTAMYIAHKYEYQDVKETRNKKDFTNSSLPVYTPAELLNILNQ